MWSHLVPCAAGGPPSSLICLFVTNCAQGQIIGFARATSDGVLSATVWDVAVNPAWQRSGLGRALMERLTKKLVRKLRRGAAEGRSLERAIAPWIGCVAPPLRWGPAAAPEPCRGLRATSGEKVRSGSVAD